eukprot:GHRR01002661.1.p2 GENE.GHRR01002661.1~~GHRR01002661.1.p2  ORF type:complete len:164 (+),score=33.31 GHRR01002661.1:239-730(+)
MIDSERTLLMERSQGIGREMLEPVAQQLHRLQLDELNEPMQKARAVPCAVRHVQSAFGELLATSPTTLIMPTGDGDSEQEATMWDCFAEVYEKEVQQLRQGDTNLPTERKRQILADILVWAEITQSHYDQKTASFVTDPHGGDASFQRIGKLLKAAKQQRGLS